MKARDVLGRRIVKIRQQRFYNRNMGRSAVSLESMTLDNGDVLLLLVEESQGDPFVEGKMLKARDRIRTGG